MRSNFLHFLSEKKAFLILLGILVLVCTFFMLYISQYFAPLPQYEKQLSVGILQDETAWDVYTFEDGQKKELRFNDGRYEGLPHRGDTFYMSRQMTEEIPGEHQDGVLLELTLLGEHVSVFLEGNLIYTDNPNAGDQIGAIEFPVGNPDEMILQRTVYVSLPPDYLGKTLTIAQSEPSSPGAESEDEGGAVYTCFVKLTTTKALSSYIVADTAKNLVPSIVLMITAMILLLLFLLRLYHKKNDWSLILLALAAFLWSFTFLFFIPYARSWNGAMPGRYEDYIMKLFFVPILVYLCIKLKKYRKWSIVLFALLIAIVIAEESGALFMLPFSIVNKALYITSASKSFLYIGFMYLCLLEWQQKNAANVRLIKRIGLLIVIVLIVCIGIMLTPTAVSDVLGSWFSSDHIIVEKALMAAVLVVAIVVTLFEFGKEAMQKKIEMELLRVKEAAAKEGYQTLSHYTEQVAMLRHDMKNHLLVMDSMLRNGKYKETDAYLRNLIAQDEGIKPIVRTKNHLVDMILNSKLKEMTDMGVELDLAVAVPEQVSIADHDLNSLLSNILDNATAALKGLPDWSIRSFMLKMHTKNGFLYIQSKNTYAPNNEKSENAAEPPRYHGYGLKIIEKISVKYNGVVTLHRDEAIFEISVAVKLP